MRKTIPQFAPTKYERGNKKPCNGCGIPSTRTFCLQCLYFDQVYRHVVAVRALLNGEP